MPGSRLVVTVLLLFTSGVNTGSFLSLKTSNLIKIIRGVILIRTRMLCGKALCTTVTCVLSLVAVASSSNKPAVVATWWFSANATKAGQVCLDVKYFGRL